MSEEFVKKRGVYRTLVALLLSSPEILTCSRTSDPSQFFGETLSRLFSIKIRNEGNITFL